MYTRRNEGVNVGSTQPYYESRLWEFLDKAQIKQSAPDILMFPDDVLLCDEEESIPLYTRCCGTLILGQRLGELCGRLSLETDIVHQHFFDLFRTKCVATHYQYAAKIAADDGSTEGDIAVLRKSRNIECTLVEQPNTVFALPS
jgi:hypothetical protein